MKIQTFLCLASLILSGCSRTEDSESAPRSKTPQRIVTFTPALTETVFALGAGGLVVGRTDWCRYPPETQAVEKLGGLGNPNYERILALKPDLFLVSAALKDIADKVEKLGVPVLRVRWETLQDVEAGVETIGEAIGKKEEGKTLRRRMEEDLARIVKKLEGAPRPPVLLVLERQPGTVLDLSVVGSNNVVDTLIRLAGGDNVFWDSPMAYPKASKEDILVRNPQFVLDFSVHAYSENSDEEKEKEAWKALPTLRAVREDKVVIMPSGFDLFPGPRIPQMAEAFARIFHPERFP